jgi:hypothetical protein
MEKSRVSHTKQKCKCQNWRTAADLSSLLKIKVNVHYEDVPPLHTVNQELYLQIFEHLLLHTHWRRDILHNISCFCKRILGHKPNTSVEALTVFTTFCTMWLSELNILLKVSHSESISWQKCRAMWRQPWQNFLKMIFSNVSRHGMCIKSEGK